jgi:phosphoribosylformylglycinamidine synthase
MGRIGAKVAFKEKIRSDALLFGETQSRIIVSIPLENISHLQKVVNKYKIPFKVLGKVEGDRLQIEDLIDLNVEELESAWRGKLV